MVLVEIRAISGNQAKVLVLPAYKKSSPWFTGANGSAKLVIGYVSSRYGA